MFLHTKRVELDAHLRLLLGGGGNSLVFLHGREAFIADLKFGDYALTLRREVEQDLAREVSRVLLTHAHFDHAGGLFAFPSVSAVLVHPNARRRLEKKGVKARFIEVEREVRLMLGAEEMLALNLGSGHTDGDLVAYFPRRKLLVTGDLFTGLREPHVDEEFGGSLRGLQAALERALTLDVERIVPGHSDVTDRAALEHVVAYLRALEEAVRAAREKGLDEDATVQSVKLGAQFDDIQPFAPIATREKNVRRMYQGLAIEGAR